MNKRGSTTKLIIWIAFLLVAVIVVFTLIQRARYVARDEEYVDAYSKIIALTINSMLYHDYDVVVELNIPSVFKVEVLENKVTVSISETKDEYEFIPDNKFKVNILRGKDKLILRKVENDRV